MINTIYLINRTLDVLVEKRYCPCGTTPHLLDQIFPLLVSDDIPPIIELNEKFHAVVLLSGNVFLVGVTSADSAFFLIDIVKQILRYFELRFGSPVEEDRIVDDITIAYRVLDFAIDSGFPLFDELNEINAIIPLDPKKPQEEINILYPWRSKGLIYKAPDFLITVTEFIDAKVGKSGVVSFYQIRGIVQILCHLSGSPEVAIKWAKKPEFDDFGFHRCVEDPRISDEIRFVPPDGFFDLLNYRISVHPPILPLTVEGSVSTVRNKVIINYKLIPNSDMKNLVIFFTLPNGTESNSLLLNKGKLRIKKLIAKWEIGDISESFRPQINGSINGEFDTGLVVQPTLTVNFESKGLASKNQITSCDIPVYEKDIAPFIGIKNNTVNGDYELQTGGFF